jgi:hypothetical protein
LCLSQKTWFTQDYSTHIASSVWAENLRIERKIAVISRSSDSELLLPLLGFFGPIDACEPCEPCAH